MSPVVMVIEEVFGDSITVGSNPRGITVNPNTNKIYVANSGSNNVSIIDGSPGSPTENTVIATIPVGIAPFGIDVNPNTNKIYVANRGSNNVSIIDGSPGSPTENTVIATIPVGAASFRLAVDTDTNRVYVAHVFAGSVSIIDGSPGSPTENTVIATIPVGSNAFAVEVDSDTNRVYVGNTFAHQIHVIDGSPGSPTENTVIASITAGNSPSQFAVKPNTNKVYVTNTGSDTVSIIDGSPGSPTENTVIATIPVGDIPAGVAFSPNTNKVFVTNQGSNNVSVIDDLLGSPTENTVIATIPVGNAPSGITSNPNTDIIYVTNALSSTVSVITGLTNNPPLANAGHDKVVDEGTIVTLDGTASSDPDSDPLSFSWTQIAGPPVMLSDATVPSPTFMALGVSSQTLLKFQLIVNDGNFNSAPDNVNILVNDLTTILVELTQTGDILTGSANIGDVDPGTELTLQFQTPPEVLPFATLARSVIPVGVSGNDVVLDFIVDEQVPGNLPLPPIDPALFFSIDFAGIDFSNPSNFPIGKLPTKKFLVDNDFPSEQRFQDSCPVISIVLLNENTGPWEQLGDPLDPSTSRIFVSSSISNTVSVIDTTTNTVVDTIQVGITPRDVTFNPDANRVYVSNFDSGTVSVIDAITNTVVDTISVGNNPDHLDFNPNTKKLYVSNFGSDALSVIDTLTNSVIATVSVGSTPVGVIFNPNTNLIYVSNFFSNTISVIDGSPGSPTENTVIATILVSGGPDTLAVDTNTNRVYVTRFNSGAVSVIDTTTNTVEDTISVGNNPAGIAFNPNTSLIYVSNSGSDTVSVIDTTTNTVVDTIQVGDGPFRIALVRGMNSLYVPNINSNEVSVLSLATNAVIDTITVDNGPSAVSRNHRVPNPLREPANDVVDGNTGQIQQCAFIAEVPHLSKFAVGRPVKATGIGSGGSDGGVFRGRTFAFADPDRTGYDGSAPTFGQVLTESGSLKVLAQILDSTGVKDSKLIVNKNTVLMQRHSGAQNWWEGMIPSNLVSGDTVFFKIIARDYNNNIGEYSGSADVPSGISASQGASFAIKPLTVGYQQDQSYSITATGITAKDKTISPQITIKNIDNEPLENIRLVLSPELRGKFLLSDYAIKSIPPNSEFTVSLKLNGRPNVDVMNNSIPYNGKVIISLDNRSPYILELSGSIPNQSASLQSLFMKSIASKSEQRYKSFEKPSLRISEAEYEVRLGSGEDVIKNASDEVIITNISDKPLKNLRIMTSLVSDHFIPDQKNIDILPAGSFVKIKLVSKLNAESHGELQGEMIIAPENGVPLTVPINIGIQLIEDKNAMYEISTISGYNVISHTADGIIIRNNSEEAIDNVRILLPQPLSRIFSLSDHSFKSIEPHGERIVYIQQRGHSDSNVKQILNDYRGEINIVSSDGMKKTIPVDIVWKGVSSKHFVVYARDDAQELTKAAQVINFLERSYPKVTEIIDEVETRTVIYTTSSLEEIKMLSDALTPSTYVYDEDIGFVWSNSDDVNMLALKEVAYRTIMQNNGTYWAKQKISLDKGNWLVDGIANYATASIVGERGMIKEQLDAFIAEPASFEWYGVSAPSQHGASYTLFKFLAEKYGDTIIDKTLNNLGSTMVSSNRCKTMEQCALLKAVYDANEWNMNDKRHDLSFVTILEEWKAYVEEKYPIIMN